MEIKSIFSSLDAAGITISEASRLLPVGRATLHNWKNGTTHGDQLRLRLVASYIRLIDQAVANKQLPLHTDVPRKERVALIRDILSKTRKV